MNSQLQGIKFEIWGEELLRDRGSLYPIYRGIRRNVCYFRGKNHRQVDLEYLNVISPQPFVMWELKYTSRPYLPLMLRSEKSKNGQKVRRIENVVMELEEKRIFAKADKAVLVTNHYFEKSLIREASKYSRIELYDQSDLARMDKERQTILGKGLAFLGVKKNKRIDEQISEIKVRNYRLAPYNVRM
jgi:hypothetical protein